MTQEDTNLLIDLCARLPYGVICKGVNLDLDVIKDEYVNREVVGPLTKIEYKYVTLGITKECELSTIKPYLRPMSSMTKEEVKELVKVQIGKYSSSSDYHNIISIDRISSFDGHSWDAWIRFKTEDGDIHQTCFIVGRVNWETTLAEIDWLNEHFFDYRGLIEKGLALEAPVGMYNF